MGVQDENLELKTDSLVETETDEVDICINGAGPVGLFAAYLLCYQNRQLHENQDHIRSLYTVFPIGEEEGEDEEDTIDSKTKDIECKNSAFGDSKKAFNKRRISQEEMNLMTMNYNLLDIPVFDRPSNRGTERNIEIGKRSEGHIGGGVRIFDKTSSRTSLSKALVLHSRTLEILYTCGLYSRFEPFFDRNSILECHFFNYLPTLKVTLNAKLEQKTLIPYMAIIPQSETERILEEALWEDFGVKVERNMELKDFVLETKSKSVNKEEQESNINNRISEKEKETEEEVSAVKCTYQNCSDWVGDNNPENSKSEKVVQSKLLIRAKYLLGCDGAHSIIRKQLGIAFEGEKLEGIFSMADVNLLAHENPRSNSQNLHPLPNHLDATSSGNSNNNNDGNDSNNKIEKRTRLAFMKNTLKRENKESEECKNGDFTSSQKTQIQEDLKQDEAEGKEEHNMLPYMISPSGACLEVFLGRQGVVALFHMPKYGYSRIIIPNVKDFTSSKPTVFSSASDKKTLPNQLHYTQANFRHPTITNALSEDEKRRLYNSISSHLKEHDDHFLSMDLEMRNPTWITCFKVQERLASCYHNKKDSQPSEMAKRIFLCGDAAHIHSPLGGQGMNMGLGDVWNLAWKINYSLYYLKNRQNRHLRPLKVWEEDNAEKAPVHFGLTSANTNNFQRVMDELVASYSKERRQVAQSILHNTTIGTKFLIHLPNLRSFIEREKGMKKIFLKCLFEICVGFLYLILRFILLYYLSPKIASNMSQIDFAYSNDEGNGKSESKRFLQAGQRVNTAGILIRRCKGRLQQQNNFHPSPLPSSSSNHLSENSIEKISILKYLDSIHHLIVVFTENQKHKHFTEQDFIDIANFPVTFARKVLLLDPYLKYQERKNGLPLSFEGTYLFASTTTVITYQQEINAIRKIFGLPIYPNWSSFSRLKKREPSPSFQSKRKNFSNEEIPFFFIIRPDGHLAYTNCLY